MGQTLQSGMSLSCQHTICCSPKGLQPPLVGRLGLVQVSPMQKTPGPAQQCSDLDYPIYTIVYLTAKGIKV